MTMKICTDISKTDFIQRKTTFLILEVLKFIKNYDIGDVNDLLSKLINYYEECNNIISIHWK